MAKKFEGFGYKQEADDYGLDFVVRSHVDADEAVCITMIVHDGHHERVFTESEVKAMLDSVDAMEQFTGAQVEMLKEYGIFKDPVHPETGE